MVICRKFSKVFAGWKYGQSLAPHSRSIVNSTLEPTIGVQQICRWGRWTPAQDARALKLELPFQALEICRLGRWAKAQRAPAPA